MNRLLTLLVAVTAIAGAAETGAAAVVAEHEPFTTTLTARNVNDRAVRIASLDSTCSCLRLEAAEKLILPGSQTEVAVVIDNRNRSGPQRVGITAYLSDPDLEPIELALEWTVRPTIAVDAIPPGGGTLARPEDVAWRDVYRFVAKERPDELARLKKRIRLSCPPEEAPEGGLQVLGIDYPGELWRFATETQADGSILVTATARDPDATVAEGLREEVAKVRTNHPRKPLIELHFIALLAKDAGSRVFDPDTLPAHRAKEDD